MFRLFTKVLANAARRKATLQLQRKIGGNKLYMWFYVFKIES